MSPRQRLQRPPWILEAVILTQLKAFRAVPRRVAPVLHPARFSRKKPVLLQVCRIPGIQSGSSVLQTC
jgi:hypothetical protein